MNFQKIRSIYSLQPGGCRLFGNGAASPFGGIPAYLYGRRPCRGGGRRNCRSALCQNVYFPLWEIIQGTFPGRPRKRSRRHQSGRRPLGTPVCTVKGNKKGTASGCSFSLALFLMFFLLLFFFERFRINGKFRRCFPKKRIRFTQCGKLSF